jgi:CRISPR/Cas system-associated endonuclease Cas1
MIGILILFVTKNEHIFIEEPGATIVSRGGRLYLRGGRMWRPKGEDEYQEVDMAARTIIASGHGFVITSDAMQVCAKRHIEVIITDATQTFIAIYAAYGQANASRSGMAARLRQFAALADPRKKLAIAKDIIRRKIDAERHEADVGKMFAADLDACRSVMGVRHVEAKSAYEWWRQWRNFELRFAKGFKPPTQWYTFKTRYIGRRQGKSGELPKQFTARFAETPLQALHNFSVAITAARLARVIAARGYDPCFGFLHDGKKPGRYSLAWDAIEPLRPELAAAVFEYAGGRKFERAEFMSQAGVVRLSTHVARECTGVALKTMPITTLVDAVRRIEGRL